jgi:hypothetical protein
MCNHQKITEAPSNHQRSPDSRWIEIAQPLSFNVVIKPHFLGNRRSSLLSKEGVLRTDPYTERLDLNQIECYKKSVLGNNPTLPEKSCDIIPQSVFIGEEEAETCPTAAYFNDFFELCKAAKSQFLKIRYSLEDAKLSDEQMQRIPITYSDAHIASSM